MESESGDWSRQALPREDSMVSRVVGMSLGEDMAASADRGKNSHEGHGKVPVEMSAYSLTSHMTHLQMSLRLGTQECPFLETMNLAQGNERRKVDYRVL